MQVAHTAPKFPLPTTSGTGRPITVAYENNGWSNKSFLEVTGPATSGEPIPFAFMRKEDALAAASSLSHGNQPALAVVWDSSSGPRGSMPWVVQSLQIATPTQDGDVHRNNEFHQTGWKVDTEPLNLETGTRSEFLADFVAKAPFTASVVAVVDGTVLIPGLSFDF